MPRWPERTRERLVESALERFTERGYSTTTVDDIAAHAGVTARTFFRYFSDKEEVLFAADDRLLPALTTAITAETSPVGALPLMSQVLGDLADLLEPDRSRLARRQRIIEADIALAGRELAKQARWQTEAAAALVHRGFDPAAADMLAAVGFALFRRCLHAWLAEEGGPPLRERITSSLPGVRVVLDERSTPSR
ncbi:MAG: TetR/AcrR family transcriptional regulator [Phycicoccus sp.]